MTRATQAKYYSSQFFDLADAISKDPERIIELPFDSPEDAQSFRLEFYSFRACAEREGLSKEYPELTAITIIPVRPERKVLRIMHKDNTPHARALKEALEKK